MTTPTAPVASAVTEGDPDRTARVLTGRSDLAVRAPQTELRQGVVTAVNVPAARVDVALGGDTTAIPAVAHLSNYRPKVNDTCWVLVTGPDLLVLDRAANLGPSVISDATTAYIGTFESRTSSTFGDMGVFGPSFTVSVSPSGRLLTSVCANIGPIDGEVPGGAMAVALSGANTQAAGEEKALWHNDFGTMTASMAIMFTGLAVGQTTITVKYKSFGGETRFGNRFLWAFPF